MSLVKSNAYRATLVDLNWRGAGAVQETRYWTSYPETLTIDSQPYEPVTTLEVEIPRIKAGWESAQASITLDSGQDLFRDLSLGRAFPSIEARIRQVTWDPKDLLDSTMLTLWQGELALSELNPEGRAGSGVLFLDSCGGDPSVVVNPVCSDRCWKKFGDLKTCKVSRTPLKESGTITVLDGLTATITGLPTAPLINYYVNGEIEFDGAFIKIRSWRSTAPETFELTEYPPQTFIDRGFSQPIEVFPGCDRSQLACTVYNNEVNWGGGIGAAMPLRDPSLERP